MCRASRASGLRSLHDINNKAKDPQKIMIRHPEDAHMALWQDPAAHVKGTFFEPLLPHAESTQLQTAAPTLSFSTYAHL